MKTLQEKDLVIGEKYVFNNPINPEITGSLFEFVEKYQYGFRFKVVFRTNPKESTHVHIGLIATCNLDWFEDKPFIPKPYVYQEIKHAYFYHSVGD